MGDDDFPRYLTTRADVHPLDEAFDRDLDAHFGPVRHIRGSRMQYIEGNVGPESRDERQFALNSEVDNAPTQPRVDGIQSGVFMWPLAVAALIGAAVLWAIGPSQMLQMLRGVL